MPSGDGCRRLAAQFFLFKLLDVLLRSLSPDSSLILVRSSESSQRNPPGKIPGKIVQISEKAKRDAKVFFPEVRANCIANSAL